MRSRFALSVLVLSIAGATAPLGAGQSESLRDHLRKYGEASRVLISCGPPVGLKEIVEHTQLTVEGTVTLVESSLDQEDNVHTDFVIDVIRLLRQRLEASAQATPGVAYPSPFVTVPAPTRPVAATTLRVSLRMPHHGRVVLDEGVVTEDAGYPTLSVGQHIIVSAYFDRHFKAWWPFGFFDVRDGRVVPLQTYLRVQPYDSVEAFAAALANPPPTVGR